MLLLDMVQFSGMVHSGLSGFLMPFLYVFFFRILSGMKGTGKIARAQRDFRQSPALRTPRQNKYKINKEEATRKSSNGFQWPPT